MSNKLINWKKISIEEKINLLINKKVSNLLKHYKIRIPEITQIINDIEKNENLKTKYQTEIVNIKNKLLTFKKYKTKKTKDNLVKVQKKHKKCQLKKKLTY